MNKGIEIGAGIGTGSFKLSMNSSYFDLITSFEENGGTSNNNSHRETVSVELLKVDVTVDNNRDGEVSFNGSDATSETEPHTFWVNDDNDGTGDGAENVGSSTKDYTNGQLSSKRDLEDLSRIQLEVSSIEDALIAGDLQLGLKWKNTTDSPAIRLYLHSDILGGTGYITDNSAAGLQIGTTYKDVLKDKSNLSTISGGSTFIFKKSFFQNLSGSEIKPLLFEGSGEGSGELAMVLLDKNDQEIGEGPSVWLNLENIKNMYVRGRADWPGQDPPRQFYGPTNDPPEPNFGFVFDQMGYPFDQPWYETGETIFFVHGWNQPHEDSISFAETTFKRIWHRGFTGRFAMFRWPTEVGLTTYNDSDYKAWKSGSALKSFVQSVPGQTKSIAAHSMGNIVTGSALEKGMSVTNYALLNAAVPAACYDTDTSLHVNSYVTPLPSSEFGFGGFLSGVSGNLVNFYLPQDFALLVWDVNNDINKPHILPAFAGSYSYDPNVTNPLERLSVSFLLHTDRLVQTNHEAMSYVIQSQTWAAGSDGRTRGSINSDVDLSQYGFGDEHSAEWNRTPQQTADFYEELLIQFQIFPNP
jgi:hypothetical protein